MPKNLWDILCQFFERKTVSNKVYTLMQLYGLNIEKGHLNSRFLHKIDELSDKLTVIGEESENHQENESGLKIKALKADRSGEYLLQRI